MRAAPLLLALLLRLRPAVAALDSGPHCPPDTDCIALDYGTGQDYYYKVHGVKLEIKLFGEDYKLTCPENVTLDSDALPRFHELETFSTVKLVKCGLPARGLAAALDAMRVRTRSVLQLLRVPPPAAAAPLSAAHLARLAMPVLQLDADDTLLADPDFLSRLPDLVDLMLTRVAIPPAALLELPAGLKSLTLVDVGLVELPRAVLERLPALQRLRLERARLTVAPDLSVAPNLETLVLDAPVDGVTLGPALKRVELHNAVDATLRGDCGALERLRVSNVTRAPPAGWLLRCGLLRELRLESLPEDALAANLLRGAVQLTELVVRNDRSCCMSPQRYGRPCKPLRLAATLLADAPALRVLDVAESCLANITIGLFGATEKLEELNLSTNNLTADMIGNLISISQFKSLKRLNLAKNPLGDLCNSTENYISNDVSPLRYMTALETLKLQDTQLSRICRDWHGLKALKELDLRWNRITELRYEDLQWRGAEGLELDLTGNNITAVLYTEQEYRGPDSATQPGLNITMNSKLTCDCSVYWFARAIQETKAAGGRGHALAAVRCREPDEPLMQVPPAQLQCALPADRCVPHCACAVTGNATVLRCERAGLDGVPRPLAPPLPVSELYLGGNEIADLRVEDLPPNLQMLDLSDNAIEELGAEEARELLARVTGRIELRGNPLACGCGQRDALRVLTAEATRLGGAACRDGRALLTLAPDELCDTATQAAAAVGVALLLLAVFVLTCLSRRSTRARIKKFLLEHPCLSWLLRPQDEYAEDEEGVRYDYDAFVSFSHHDEKFVTEELVPGLEGGARGRRLCLHYRDWTPGEWIPTQIEQSVRRSRHTVVVLSAAFVRSSWTRAEFREAHAAALRDARPRLVVVLLADAPADLPALPDAELRAFLAANTYLRRGDPWFWTKLLRAVPRGRDRLPLPPDPPPPHPPRHPHPAPPAA